ncbi:MAG: TolC family protein [Bryobacter sp.]|jgi:outer membrane protein TolC|nr:TolC family protein [Bryobacter sp. CoA8 C33]
MIWLVLTLLAAEPMPLSLSKAVELATAPNGNLRLAMIRETISEAEAKRRQALGAFLPQLEGMAGAASQTRNLQAFGFSLGPAVPFQIPSFVGPFTVVDYRVSATQSILDLSAIYRYQAARLRKEVADAEVRQARQVTIQQVARTYVLVLRAEAALDAARAGQALAERLVLLAESQKRAGTGTGIELTRAKVQLQNEKQRVLVASNEGERAGLELKRQTGISFDQELKLTDRMNDGSEAAPGLAAALESAFAGRLDLLAQERRRSALGLSVRGIRAERLPSLASSGDYGVIGDGSRMLPTRSVAIGLRVPVFDGGRREARLAEAGTQLRQESLRTEDLKRQIEVEVRQALQALENARAQIEAARLGLELAGQELEQAQRRTEAGVASGVELTDAQTRLARARDNQLAALSQFNLARIEVAAATGTMETAAKGMVH